MSTQSWLRAIRAMLDDMGVQYAFAVEHQHIRLIVRGNGQMAHVTISVSPSDRKALHAVRRDVRHALGLVCKPQVA